MDSKEKARHSDLQPRHEDQKALRSKDLTLFNEGIESHAILKITKNRAHGRIAISDRLQPACCSNRRFDRSGLASLPLPYPRRPSV